MTRISAIIVTRNNTKDVAPCLRSLLESRRAVDEIVVIDNNSTDGTADRVRRDFPAVSVVDFWDNPGFGEGNNRGARVASGDYLLLINPDATLAPDGVGHLADALDHDPGVGIAVPKVVLAAERSVINSAGLCVNAIGYGWDRGYLEWDAGQYDVPETILAGSGCVLLVRADVYQSLGGFDAPYFLYYEDLDLCWRSSVAGRPVRYVPAATAYHAMKVSGRPALYNDYLDHRNRFRTLLKNMAPRTLLGIVPRVLAFEAGSIWAFARHRQWSRVRLRARAWLWNIGHLLDTWKRRVATQLGRRVADQALAGLFASGEAPRLRAALPGYVVAYDHLIDRARLSTDVTMTINDAAALGLGWYGPESFEGSPSRWCCGYGILFLRAPDSCTRAKLTVRCASVHPTEVVIRTDRVERGRFALAPGPWRDLTSEVPLDGDIVRVEILVAPTFVPAEASPGSPDDRTLGVTVTSLALHPSTAMADSRPNVVELQQRER